MQILAQSQKLEEKEIECEELRNALSQVLSSKAESNHSIDSLDKESKIAAKIEECENLKKQLEEI